MVKRYLHILVTNELQLKILNFRLKSHGDVNKCDFDGLTALHLACAGNEPQAVKCLLESGARPNCNGNQHYSSPLIIAAHHGHLECVKVGATYTLLSIFYILSLKENGDSIVNALSPNKLFRR